MVGMKFSISGVYSSAVSKILVERGHIPTRLSKTLVDRLGGLGALDDEPDVYIKDMSRWQGIVLIGDGAKVMADEIVSEAKEAGVFYLPKSYGAVYKARVLERVRNGYIVDLDGRRGLVKSRLYETEVNAVQVTGYARSVSKVLLTDSVRIRSGGAEAVRLSRFSREFRESDLPGGWKWRSQGSELEKEDVLKKAQDIEEMVLSPEIPDGRCVLPGVDYVEVVLGLNAKKIMDGWRRKLVPTMDGHHYLKSLGPEYSALVDFAERVKELIPDKFDELISQTIVRGVYPRSTEEIKIVHMKPNGIDIEYSPVYVVHSDADTIITKRRIMSSGRYDGLGVERQPGDYALTEFKVNQWYYTTSYYRRDGAKIGEYVNINTQPEIAKGFIRYIDLYVDVVRKRGEIKVIDKEELDGALADGYISKEVYDKANQVAEEVARLLETKEDEDGISPRSPESP